MAHVLIVDDSPTDLLKMKQVLEREGYTVSESESGDEAIAKARTDPPDVIVMDVVMPGMNGFQATRTLSRDPSTSEIPVIVCSAKDQETDRMWAKRQGAREYLVKPVQDADLIAKLRIVLGAG